MQYIEINKNHTSRTVLPTLKTNISPRNRATVLKFPSHMLGLLPGAEGLSPRGGLGGRECLSCFLSEVEWILRTGRVGKGLVGSRGSAGGPKEEKEGGNQKAVGSIFPTTLNVIRQLGHVFLKILSKYFFCLQLQYNFQCPAANYF